MTDTTTTEEIELLTLMGICERFHNLDGLPWAFLSSSQLHEATGVDMLSCSRYLLFLDSLDQLPATVPDDDAPGATILDSIVRHDAQFSYAVRIGYKLSGNAEPTDPLTKTLVERAKERIPLRSNNNPGFWETQS